MAELAIELLRRGYTALPRLWSSEPDDGDYALHRLLGRQAHVVRGEEGARLFYDQTAIEREGVVPAPLSRVLFGKGAVHGLDGERHRRRKRIFLDVLTPGSVEELGDQVARELGASAESWPRRAPFTLFDELVRVYGTCVMRWSGVAVASAEAELAARRMAAIVDGFGFGPVAYPRACWARWWADRWAGRIVPAAREGQASPPPGTMLHALATGSGRELPVETAAVELLNILRPTVAVAWLGAFAVIELARSPEHGPALAEPGARTARWHFVDEVRRTAPFVPALAGRVRRDTTFRGHRLAQGDLVVLDVPGTNHRSWGDPGLFRPARFAERTPNAFEHVPQGGGDPREGHRCPGEPVAMTLLDRTLQAFAGMVFTISGGATSLRRIPASPAGRLVVTSVVQPGLSPA